MTCEGRRRFLRRAGALGLALGCPCVARAAPEPPIADAHSHIGLYSPRMLHGSLRAQMQESGVTLLSWNIVGDGRWTTRDAAARGHRRRQRIVPASGAQAAYLREKLDAMRAYLAKDELRFVETSADIDAARVGLSPCRDRRGRRRNRGRRPGAARQGLCRGAAPPAARARTSATPWAKTSRPNRRSTTE